MIKLPYVGKRWHMENQLVNLARRPPMRRRAVVVRWIKVAHLHLLLLLNDQTNRCRVGQNRTQSFRLCDISSLLLFDLFCQEIRPIFLTYVTRISHATQYRQEPVRKGCSHCERENWKRLLMHGIYRWILRIGPKANHLVGPIAAIWGRCATYQNTMSCSCTP